MNLGAGCGPLRLCVRILTLGMLNLLLCLFPLTTHRKASPVLDSCSLKRKPPVMLIPTFEFVQKKEQKVNIFVFLTYVIL